MEQERYTGSWEHNGRSITAAAAIGLIGIGVFYFYLQSIVAAVAMVAAHLFGFETAGGDGKEMSDEFVAALRVVVFATQYLFMLIPSWFLISRFHTRDVGAYVRLGNFSFAQTALAVVGTVSLIPLSLFFSTYLTELLGIPPDVSNDQAAFFTSYTPVEFAWLVFGVSVTPAVCEEIFFRGHVQRTLERTMSVHSIWIIGILFGLFHFQPLGLASLSLLGLYFGYLFYRSKSLYPSMAAHFTNNTIALLFTYRPFVEGQEWMERIGSDDLGMLNIGALPVAAGVIALFHRSTRRKEATPVLIPLTAGVPEVISVVDGAQRWMINSGRDGNSSRTASDTAPYTGMYDEYPEKKIRSPWITRRSAGRR